ncbi:LOW QUALITY PROTEIN: RING-H2 finger protein ATL66-like [Juglans microcarpa x Juglans regia]|uniref:LOW QUALITY PROTEIN: RING-H2 finger protein ATL66-like n=1 Tax=Juglans microcarpa x Juglans regia TaxID=2249226 RepID=UPI001B7EDA48|nr:LOW QUALITY PROTEIN: RING-H2 finger protein ATL66-like [Juglans microcarpa x Juglans regia]
MASVSQDSQPMFQWHFNEFDDRGFEVRGRTLFLIVILFSVLLLFTLLFLYAAGSTCTATSPFPTSSPQPAPRGLDSSTIKSFPIIPLRSLEAPNSMVQAECCICLGVFEDGEKVKVLPPCRHCYHSECVDRWLSGHSSCPLCRASLGVDAQVESAVPQTNYLP